MLLARIFRGGCRGRVAALLRKVRNVMIGPIKARPSYGKFILPACFFPWETCLTGFSLKRLFVWASPFVISFCLKPDDFIRQGRASGVGKDQPSTHLSSERFCTCKECKGVRIISKRIWIVKATATVRANSTCQGYNLSRKSRWPA